MPWCLEDHLASTKQVCHPLPCCWVGEYQSCRSKPPSQKVVGSSILLPTPLAQNPSSGQKKRTTSQEENRGQYITSRVNGTNSEWNSPGDVNGTNSLDIGLHGHSKRPCHPRNHGWFQGVCWVFDQIPGLTITVIPMWSAATYVIYPVGSHFDGLLSSYYSDPRSCSIACQDTWHLRHSGVLWVPPQVWCWLRILRTSLV